jgi:FlaA1/EpsC-like NDP-sugar epimerase
MFPNVCETKIVGARHGEKLYEELMTSYEANSCIEAPDMFILLPPGNDLVDCEKNKVVSPCGYSSKNMSPLNKAEIEDLLKKAGII